MTNDTDQKNIDLCLGCGGTIDNAVRVERFGPFSSPVRQTRCGHCGFMEFFRQQILVQKCPYRKPAERPTPDGKAPKSYLRKVETFLNSLETAP